MRSEFIAAAILLSLAAAASAQTGTRITLPPNTRKTADSGCQHVFVKPDVPSECRNRLPTGCASTRPVEMWAPYCRSA